MMKLVTELTDRCLINYICFEMDIINQEMNLEEVK